MPLKSGISFFGNKYFEQDFLAIYRNKVVVPFSSCMKPR